MRSFLLVVLTALLLVAGCDSAEKQAGTAAPEMKVLDVQQFNDMKAAYKGKVLMVNFFASWCPPCQAETPGFITFYESNKDKNFALVGVSIDEKMEDAQKFVDDMKVTYPTYLASEALSRQLGIQNVPTTIFYRPDGTLYNVMVGFIEEEQLAALIDEIGKQ